MKKFGLKVLAILLIISLCGCGEKDNKTSSGGVNSNEKIDNEETDNKENGQIDDDLLSDDLKENSHIKSNYQDFESPYKPLYVRKGYIIVEDESTGLRGLIDGCGNTVLDVKYQHMEFPLNTELDIVKAATSDDSGNKVFMYDFDGKELVSNFIRTLEDVLYVEGGFDKGEYLSIIPGNKETLLVDSFGNIIETYGAEKEYYQIYCDKYIAGYYINSDYLGTQLVDSEENVIYKGGIGYYIEENYLLTEERNENEPYCVYVKVLDIEGNELIKEKIEIEMESIEDYDGPHALDDYSVAFQKFKDGDEYYAIYNVETRERTDYIFTDLERMVDGKCFAEIEDERYVIIDNKGNVLHELPANFECEDEYENLMIVSYDDAAGETRYNLINLNGDFVLEDSVEYIEFIYSDYNKYHSRNCVMLRIIDNKDEGLQRYTNFNGDTLFTEEERKTFGRSDDTTYKISDDDSIMYVVNYSDGIYKYKGFDINYHNDSQTNEGGYGNIDDYSSDITESVETGNPMYAEYSQLVEEYYEKNLPELQEANMPEDMFYALCDINGDGTKDLICGIYEEYLGENVSIDSMLVPEIYTYYDGEVEGIYIDNIGSGWWKIPYYICTNELYKEAGVIRKHWGGTGYLCDEFYKVNTDLSTGVEAFFYPIETIEMDSTMYPEIEYRITKMNLGQEIVTEDEYNSAMNGYESVSFMPVKITQESVEKLRNGEVE